LVGRRAVELVDNSVVLKEYQKAKRMEIAMAERKVV
jgi:hypothetical protein